MDFNARVIIIGWGDETNVCVCFGILEQILEIFADLDLLDRERWSSWAVILCLVCCSFRLWLSNHRRCYSNLRIIYCFYFFLWNSYGLLRYNHSCIIVQYFYHFWQLRLNILVFKRTIWSSTRIAYRFSFYNWNCDHLNCCFLFDQRFNSYSTDSKLNIILASHQLKLDDSCIVIMHDFAWKYLYFSCSLLFEGQAANNTLICHIAVVQSHHFDFV